MVTTTRNTARAMIALRETVLPHLEPIELVDTSLGSTPATRASSARIRAISSWGSSSVWTLTCGGSSSVTWTTSAAGPTASRTWPSVTGRSGWTRKMAPPLKSMPKLRPGTNRLTTEISRTTAEIENHRRRRPTKSKLVSPRYMRLARDTDEILLAGSDGGADADEATLLEQAESGEQGHRRPGEEPGGEEVDHGGQAEGEREAPHRPDGQQVQHQGGRERHRVGRDQGVERALPAPVDRGPQRLALADLVLEPFEEHHVGVGRDADGHDQPGDPGQGQGEADGLAHQDHDADVEGGRDGQADPDDQAKAPVVGEHVEEHQAEPDGPADQAGPERVGPQGGADGGAVLRVELQGQGTRGDQRGQVLGLGLGLAGDHRRLAGLLELGPGRGDVGAAEGDRAHQQLGGVGVRAQLPGRLAGAQDHVLVGHVLVRIRLGLGAVDRLERALAVPGVA